jgi:Putative zinc-finger
MDHEYAIKNHAAEQYVLGELNPHDREEFEEHYFGCPECADAVKTGTYFVDSARVVWEEQASRPSLARQVVEMKPRTRLTLWQRLAPAGSIAAAVLLALVGYQNMIEIPALSAGSSQVKPSILSRTLVRPGARGNASSENVVTIKPGQKSVLLDMDVNAEKAFPYYRVEVDTPSGKPVMQTDPAPAEHELAIELPSSKLPPGPYVLLVRGQTESSGQAGPEVARSNFLVKE